MFRDVPSKVDFNTLPIGERKRLINDEESRAKKLQDFIKLNRKTRNANTGGPAFPFVDSASPLEHPGMTLRNYFAAKAMQAIYPQDFEYEETARRAYQQANTMLKAGKQND